MTSSPRREAGILLHITSLPGPGPNGTLGPDAYRFVDFLSAAGMSVWQVLPVNPPGPGNSPYSAKSSFAGSPALLSLDGLGLPGFEQAGDTASTQVLREAHHGLSPEQRAELDAFARDAAWWLDDWALFAALEEEHGPAWHDWPAPLVRLHPDVLERTRSALADRVDFHRFVQWCFDQQWRALRAYAERSGIRIFGDLPIFPALDSADVWAYQEIFKLDQQGHPIVVAGVPPDLFSETGQRWGNPLYRWDAEAARGYSYWKARLRRAFELYHMLRIDHFRGFEAAWEIDAAEPTAVKGTWVPGPGARLFEALREELGEMEIVVEDLGLITPEVRALRDQLGYPGMAVLQFAFDGSPGNPYLPANQVANSVVYTGTHDNDTSVGWWASLTSLERQRVRAATGREMADPAWDLARTAFESPAKLAILPMQDVLRLGSSARMNTPGTADGNWRWRFGWSQVTSGLAEALAELASGSGRLNPIRHREAP